jgi:CubicO group peptidase (beta-lactamase class C family)
MKPKLLPLLFFLVNIASYSQQKYKVSYAQLTEFEGLYEYANNAQMKIAASPVDTLLYAIINESRYRLTPFGKDEFLNSGNEKVTFFRDNKSAIVAVGDQTGKFKLLSKDIKYPKEMWYPRLDVSKYVYQQPTDDNDGIVSGPLYKSGLNKASLDELMQKMLDGTYKNVHSILIMKDNKLVFEEYFYEHNKQKLHEMRSASKSFISALAGIAVEQGYIKSINETVLSYFPEYTFKKDLEAKKQMTIKHLLTNTSGLDCDTYNPKAYGNESEMGYTDDWIQYSLDLPMIDSAGGKGQYCSSNPIIMGRIIEKATKMTIPQFAEKTLFKGLGIKNYIWNFKPDKSSAETFCQVNLTSRDMIKFGAMYLNKGVWNDQQVLTKDWIKQSWAKHTNIEGLDYGYLWWTKYLEANGVRYYGKLAQGNGGQKIYIFEELNLVVVTTAGHYNVQSPINEIVAKYILSSFK